MASGEVLPPGSRGHYPPPGTAFNLDEWIPCEAYLGCTVQGEADTGTTDELARAVRKLHRRYERDRRNDGSSAEVYVRVTPAGLFLRVMTAFQPGTEHDGIRDGVREFFETVRIARCTANHEPCTRALVWVYNRQPFGGSRPNASEMVDRRMECHGVVCRDLRDATRLANTLAMAFFEMRHIQQPYTQPVAFGNAIGGGNAFSAVGGAVFMSDPMRQQGLPAAGDLPPAYTPAAHHAGTRQLPPLRSQVGKHRNSSKRRQIIEVAAVPQAQDEDDGDLDSDLHPSPASNASTKPRSVTPRGDTDMGIMTDRPSSSKTRGEGVSPRGQHNTRNSTVSLHSAVSLSERGSRLGALPDVSTNSWGSSAV